jgi:hypothetical protein
MLLILVLDVLGALIQKADQWGLFQHFGTNAIPHRASFYADDMILFMLSEEQEFQTLRHTFQIFKGASGLGCNLRKFQLVPIRC